MTDKNRAFWNEYLTCLYLALFSLPPTFDAKTRSQTIAFLQQLDFPNIKLSGQYRDYLAENTINRCYTRESSVGWLQRFVRNSGLASMVNVDPVRLERMSHFTGKKIQQRYGLDPAELVKRPTLSSYLVEHLLSTGHMNRADCHVPEVSKADAVAKSSESMNKSLSVSLYTHYPIQVASNRTVKGQLDQMIGCKADYDRNLINCEVPAEHIYAIKSRQQKPPQPEGRDIDNVDKHLLKVARTLGEHSVVPFNIQQPMSGEQLERHPIPRVNPGPKQLNQKLLIPINELSNCPVRQITDFKLAENGQLISKRAKLEIPVECHPASETQQTKRWSSHKLGDKTEVLSRPKPKPKPKPKAKLKFKPMTAVGTNPLKYLKPPIGQKQARATDVRETDVRVIDLSNSTSGELPPYLRPIPSFAKGGDLPP